jgi:predicted HAD superfamily Cof-like phosphohydrolase
MKYEIISDNAYMIQQYHKRSGNLEPDPDMYETLIKEEFQEFIEENDPENKLKELTDLMYVIYGYAYAKGWNIDEAFYRVYENNLGRMVQPDGTIKRREDGKIIKNKDFPKVNLSDLVQGK